MLKSVFFNYSNYCSIQITKSIDKKCNSRLVLHITVATALNRMSYVILTFRLSPGPDFNWLRAPYRKGCSSSLILVPSFVVTRVPVRALGRVFDPRCRGKVFVLNSSFYVVKILVRKLFTRSLKSRKEEK